MISKDARCPSFLVITHNRSLDVGRCVGIVGFVGDLIARKEANNIVVLAQLINDVLVALKQLNVPLRFVSGFMELVDDDKPYTKFGAFLPIDRQCRLAEITNDINPSVVQHLHACRVIFCGVDGIGTDDIGLERLEEGNIAFAVGLVRERIRIFGTL